MMSHARVPVNTLLCILNYMHTYTILTQDIMLLTDAVLSHCKFGVYIPNFLLLIKGLPTT